MKTAKQTAEDILKIICKDRDYEKEISNSCDKPTITYLKEIFLFNEFGHNIITRRCMQDFFEKISKHKEDKLVLNFSKIEFISRTCADEYIKSKNSSLKNITESNLNKNVSDMLSVITHIPTLTKIGYNECLEYYAMHKHGELLLNNLIIEIEAKIKEE